MGDVSLVELIAVLAAGLFAGFVNTMAGGGSFIALLALEFAGLPIGVANATNRVAVGAQTLTAIIGYRRQGKFDPKRSALYAAPTLLGAILGAYLVIDLPEQLLHGALGVCMILMLLAIIFDVKGRLQKRGQGSSAPRWLIYPALFVTGIYGGAIQAGVGFFLFAALLFVAGEGLLDAAVHNMFIVAAYTLVVLAMFASRGKVNWPVGLVLAVGSMIGAWISSHIAVANGDKVVRIVLALMLAVMAVRYLGLIPGL
jgi:uncharacterized protein